MTKCFLVVIVMSSIACVKIPCGCIVATQEIWAGIFEKSFNYIENLLLPIIKNGFLVVSMILHSKVQKGLILYFRVKCRSFYTQIPE